MTAVSIAVGIDWFRPATMRPMREREVRVRGDLGHPDHGVSVSADGLKRYRLADASPETIRRVASVYAAKYGPEQGTVLLRLTDS